MKVQTILSDNGREYSGRLDKHPYELFLQLEDIEHRTTKVGRPQSNGNIATQTLVDMIPVDQLMNELPRWAINAPHPLTPRPR